MANKKNIVYNCNNYHTQQPIPIKNKYDHDSDDELIDDGNWQQTVSQYFETGVSGSMIGSSIMTNTANANPSHVTNPSANLIHANPSHVNTTHVTNPNTNISNTTNGAIETNPSVINIGNAVIQDCTDRDQPSMTSLINNIKSTFPVEPTSSSTQVSSQQPITTTIALAKSITNIASQLIYTDQIITLATDADDPHTCIIEACELDTNTHTTTKSLWKLTSCNIINAKIAKTSTSNSIILYGQINKDISIIDTTGIENLIKRRGNSRLSDIACLSNEVVVIKITLGSVDWSTGIHGNSEVYISSITCTTNDKICVAGIHNSTCLTYRSVNYNEVCNLGNPNMKAFVVAWDSDGKFMWDTHVYCYEMLSDLHDCQLVINNTMPVVKQVNDTQVVLMGICDDQVQFFDSKKKLHENITRIGNVDANLISLFKVEYDISTGQHNTASYYPIQASKLPTSFVFDFVMHNGVTVTMLSVSDALCSIMDLAFSGTLIWRLDDIEAVPVVLSIDAVVTMMIANGNRVEAVLASTSNQININDKVHVIKQDECMLLDVMTCNSRMLTITNKQRLVPNSTTGALVVMNCN